MLLKCRWCNTSLNGQFKIRDHERDCHAKEYYTERVHQLESSAKRDTEMAKQLRARYNITD